VGVPEVAVTMLSDNVEFFLCQPDNFSVLSVWGSRTVVMSCWKGAVAVCTSGLVGAVYSPQGLESLERHLWAFDFAAGPHPLS
jgi:hypothetical protein